MLIELVERLDAAASELLACLKGGEASSEELLGVLSGTKAVRGKVDTVQALAAAGVAGSRNHGDGGAHVLAESTGVSRRPQSGPDYRGHWRYARGARCC